MCRHCGARSHALLAKDAPIEDDVRSTFIDEVVEVLRAWHADLLDKLRDGTLTGETVATAYQTVDRTFQVRAGAFTASVERLWVDGATAGRAASIRRYDLDVEPDLDPVVVEELKRHADDAAASVSERMTDDLARAIHDAWDKGLSAKRIERILRDEVFPEMRGYEAERMARTEGTSAANRGQLSSIRDSGAVGKTWLAEDGPRTRDSHDETDGQTVALDEEFTTGKGNSALYPGDPTLPPSDRINCRCGMAPAWSLPD